MGGGHSLFSDKGKGAWESKNNFLKEKVKQVKKEGDSGCCFEMLTIATLPTCLWLHGLKYSCQRLASQDLSADPL